MSDKVTGAAARLHQRVGGASKFSQHTKDYLRSIQAVGGAPIVSGCPTHVSQGSRECMTRRDQQQCDVLTIPGLVTMADECVSNNTRYRTRYRLVTGTPHVCTASKGTVKIEPVLPQQMHVVSTRAFPCDPTRDMYAQEAVVSHFRNINEVVKRLAANPSTKRRHWRLRTTIIPYMNRAVKCVRLSSGGEEMPPMDYDSDTEDSYGSWIYPSRVRYPLPRPDEPLLKEEDETTLRCMVCLQRAVATVCVPCGHATMCVTCSTRYCTENHEAVSKLVDECLRNHAFDHQRSLFVQCPDCRDAIESVVRLFVPKNAKAKKRKREFVFSSSE
jgi:hypothetical protein